ncbi:hopanoid-associated sugar epimerase [Actinomycetota bacterium]
MRFLVTGATGFVGSHIAHKLLESGHDVNVLVRKTSSTRNIQGLPFKVVYGDLRDMDSLKKAASGCKGLFHAAAMYGFWARNPQDFYDINVEGTRNIIEAAISQGLEKIVYTSSESTLDSGSGTNGNGYKLASIDDVFGDYKRSKLLAEIEVLRLCKKGYPVTIVNPTTPIGKGDIYPTPTGKIVLDMLNGAMPAYVNTGLNIIDVEDVAEGHLLAYEKGVCGERYVLGNENLTLKDMLEMIAGIAGLDAPKVQIPLGAARFLAYIDEFLSGKIFKKHPKIPLAAVKTAYKFKYYDCSSDAKKLGLDPGPVKMAFEKSIRWFKENGYVKN